MRAAAPSRPRARRCAQEIYKDEGSLHALETLWRLPFLYLAVLGVRGVCILLLNPLFKLAGTGAPARARAARLRAARSAPGSARRDSIPRRSAPGRRLCKRGALASPLQPARADRAVR